MPPFIVIANWKMNKSFLQTCSWFQEHATKLTEIAHHKKHEVVICPSFDALYAVHQINSNISLGAQDCSPHDVGPFTGQVSAQSLKQIGCSYCIVGHSERRRLGETHENIAQKIDQLLEHELCPIICIGEGSHDREQGIIKQALSQQITPLMQSLMRSNKPFIIAYEPIWAIGSGITPNLSELTTAFTIISSLLSSIPRGQYRLMYGGSVDEKNAATIASIEHIEGFLIGNASLDFQKLQKIVSLSR